MPNKKCYWVYILLCDNGSYYTGYTNNLTKRYLAHCNGTACKYTRSFKPINIAQHWELDDKSMAMKIERAIKKLSREAKETLIHQPSLLNNVLNKNGLILSNAS